MKKKYEFAFVVEGLGETCDEAFYDLLLDLKVDPKAALESRLVRDVAFKRCGADPLDGEDLESLVGMINWHPPSDESAKIFS
ncbi:MAG TPA: hypothetical protein EYN66_18150 [Myxococcales bacterium]|nr:hypothetical protein [Myxococcales bacterium]